MVNQFVDWAHDRLFDSQEAIEYLSGRGVSIDQCKRHRIGFTGGMFDVDSDSDPNHSDNCKDRDKKRAWCDTCRYKFWSTLWEEGDPKVGKRIEGSVILPLTSYSGLTIGFQVRSIATKSYDTYVINKRPEGYFFGISSNLEGIWNSKSVCLTEGGFDQLVIERLAFPYAIGLTTNSVNKLQHAFLKRFVKKIYLCFDGDSPGRAGALSFIKNSSLEVHDIKIPRSYEVKDPNALWKKLGDKKFADVMKPLFGVI